MTLCFAVMFCVFDIHLKLVTLRCARPDLFRKQDLGSVLFPIGIISHSIKHMDGEFSVKGS